MTVRKTTCTPNTNRFSPNYINQKWKDQLLSNIIWYSSITIQSNWLYIKRHQTNMLKRSVIAVSGVINTNGADHYIAIDIFSQITDSIPRLLYCRFRSWYKTIKNTIMMVILFGWQKTGNKNSMFLSIPVATTYRMDKWPEMIIWNTSSCYLQKWMTGAYIICHNWPARSVWWSCRKQLRQTSSYSYSKGIQASTAIELAEGRRMDSWSVWLQSYNPKPHSWYHIILHCQNC